jgi:hypothetical protein
MNRATAEVGENGAADATSLTARIHRRAKKHHTKRSRHISLVPPSNNNATLAGAAIAHICPFTKLDFPGLRRGILALLGRSISWQATQHWRSGRTRLPPWAAERFATEIERRCREGEAIASELREYIRDWRPYDRSHPAFLQLDPESGLRRKFRG